VVCLRVRQKTLISALNFQKMKTINKLVLAILTLFYALNSQAVTRPESLVRQFYDWRFKSQFTGVPEMATLKVAELFLSSELICLLDRARDYRSRFVKNYPTDKPPFIEGDMFTSLFEGANRYKLESVKVNGENAIVQLHFYHDQGAQKDKAGWRDTVLLRQKNHQWRITDIQYGGQFDFGNSGSLRLNLYDELSKENNELDWHGKTQLNLCRYGNLLR